MAIREASAAVGSEKALILDALASNVRLDGRGKDEFRQVRFGLVEIGAELHLIGRLIGSQWVADSHHAHKGGVRGVGGGADGKDQSEEHGQRRDRGAIR